MKKKIKNEKITDFFFIFFTRGALPYVQYDIFFGLEERWLKSTEKQHSRRVIFLHRKNPTQKFRHECPYSAGFRAEIAEVLVPSPDDCIPRKLH